MSHSARFRCGRCGSVSVPRDDAGDQQARVVIEAAGAQTTGDTRGERAATLIAASTKNILDGRLMQIGLEVTDLAYVIQLALAPVFLLTGIGAVLSVLTTRLSRTVDRARQLEDHLVGLDPSLRPPVYAELHLLSQRARMANWAISLCTACALLVCTVVGLLFVGAVLKLDVSAAIAWLFIIAMVMLILGLVIFLREIFLATAALCFGPLRRKI